MTTELCGKFEAPIFDAVVLAAGAGRRFGGGKLTATHRGRPLIEGALTAAFAAPVRSVTVTVGADPAVADAARAFAARTGQATRLHLAQVADHAEGLAASLRAGVASWPADSGGLLVFLGDMPSVPNALPARLAAAMGPGVLAAAPVHRGRRGHPVLFSQTLRPALSALQGDAGAGKILSDLGDALVLLPTDDPGVLLDIDMPGDLAMN